jgi:hypothetical protein
MQRWLSHELTAVAESVDEFLVKFGEGFSAVVNISAKTGIVEPEIRGPTVFKRDKDVEYTLFLPYDVIMRQHDSRRMAARYILSGIRAIFERAGIGLEQLDATMNALTEHLSSDPSMLSSPWPMN